jgi:uncharacterized membrane protein
MFTAFIDNYEGILHHIAEFSALTLEFIGVLIIVPGSAKSLFSMVRRLIQHRTINIVIELGKTLALALEFKMGAEIIKTVIVHDLKELAVLGIVILIRALLAFLIHWEIKMEKKDEEQEAE